MIKKIVFFAALFFSFAAKSQPTTETAMSFIRDTGRLLTVTGKVVEASYVIDNDFNSVFLQILDENNEDFYLTAMSEMANFNEIPPVSEALIGKTVKATFTESAENQIVEYRPAILPDGVANRGEEVDPSITVYTIKGTQESVVEFSESYKVVFRTEKGDTMFFWADSGDFNGHDPNSFNGQGVKISFIQYELLNLRNFEVID